MKTKYLLISILFIISIAITGCKDEEQMTLEKYMEENPTVKDQVEKTVEGLSNEDTETSVAFNDNTIVVTAKLSTIYSEKMIKKMEKAFNEMPQDSFEDALTQLEESSGISGIELKLILQNGDGVNVTERSYKKDGNSL